MTMQFANLLCRQGARLRLAALTVAIVLLSVATSVGQGRAECAVIKSQTLARAVRYCAFLPPSFDTDKSRHYPVIYYLHGLGDNEQSLLNSGGWDMISELRSRGKIGDFIVLAPYGGHSFYLNSKDGKLRYEDFLTQEFMPQMERKYRGDGAREHRGIMGVSMGGYGALRLAFKRPDDFASVSAQMPALIPELPKNLGSENGSLSALLSDIFGSPVDREYFDRNNVFYFARTTSAAKLKRMKIYFDVGNNDDYGFEAGAEQLDKLLTSRGIPHQFHLYPGGHNVSFVMQHFADVLEFQWAAIGK